MRKPLRLAAVGARQRFLHLSPKPCVVFARFVLLLHALGLIGPLARGGVRLVIEGVHLEAGDAQFLAHKGGGGGEVAP